MATGASPISAPPAAAPSAPAASAPSSAPSSATATPSTATPQTPVAGQQAPSTVGQETIATGGAPSTTAPVGPPKNTDFPNTGDGQIAFLSALDKYEKDHPAGSGDAAELAAAQAAVAEKPADGAAQEPIAPAEGEAKTAQTAAAATPQQLAEMMEKTPEFKAFMEAHPEVKGPVFQMARELASVAPIREIFPTVADAQFAQEYSGAMVGLKTAALRAIDNPESLPEFLNQFDSQFQRVDAQGQPILDAQGRPTFDEDHRVVLDGLFNREIQGYTTQFSGEMEQLKAKLQGYYPSEAAKAADQQRYDNLDLATMALGVLEQVRSGEIFKPTPPQLAADATPEQKAWFEQQKAELAAKQAELDNNQKGASKEARAAAAAKFQASVRNDMGSAAGLVLGETLKQIVDSGVYIPEFYLQKKFLDPTTGKELNTPDISARLFLQFENELMRPGSRTLMEITQHELLPANEQTRQIRAQWYAQKAAEIMPGLVQKEVDAIQKLVKVDQTKQEEILKKRREAASPEPSTGGSSLPQAASREQILQAAEEAAKKDPGWAGANPTEKQARILTQVNRMSRK